MSANWAPQFVAGAPAWQPLFGSGALTIDSVTPTTTGAAVAYSGTATHYRVDGGAAVAVPSNPFTFAGLTPNTEPHTIELSGDGGSSWTAPETFGTLNPGSGVGGVGGMVLVGAVVAAVEIDSAPPLGGVAYGPVVAAVERDSAVALASGGGAGGTASAAQVWEGLALEAGLTPGAMLRIVMAAVAGRTEGVGTGTERYFSVDGTKARITATFDRDGNRATIVLDGSP